MINRVTTLSGLFFFALFLLAGTPTVFADTAVLATVNGDSINESALQERIKAIHRFTPPTRPQGGALGVSIQDLVQEIIDERLIIQDAYKMELHKSADFEKKIKSFVTTQSILRLRKEEVLDKINVSEEDVLDYFSKHHGKLGQAPEGSLDKIKRRIEKKLRKEKEKELSDKIVAELRKKADVWIDADLVDSLDPKKDYQGKKSVVARVNGAPISLEAFFKEIEYVGHKQAMMERMSRQNSDPMRNQKALNKDALGQLITFRLIEQEASNRDYASDPAFMDMVNARKNQILVNAFKAKIIYPLAAPTESQLRQYYDEHIEEFKTGYELRYAEMVFQFREDADKALEELKQGANFDFLAAQVSDRWNPRRGAGWVNSDRLSPAIKDALTRLEIGGNSDVIPDERQYKIFKLKGKRGEERAEFSKVRPKIERLVVQRNFDKVLSEYLKRLRKASTIKINEEALKSIEEQYWSNSPK